MPSVHIGILAKSPFPEVSQLYSEYLLTNTMSQHIFSDKFSIRMLDLSKTDSATEEERNTELYQWTCLFKATTWEEVNQLSKKNEYLQEAASFLHQLTTDEKIQLQCEARERYRMDMASVEHSGMMKGEKVGYERGEKNGYERGVNQVSSLITILLQQNRLDDLSRISSDSEFREKMMREFSL